ncbi:MAG: response regulator transcription factor, partial [Thermodesulfobacteriota bacterium]|nr:response regulator transcription factor [Thermodesulfobacteriota bacterium]
MIRLLIADDHAVVREGLKQIVSDTHDIIIADEASNGHEVLQKVQKMAQNDYSVIVLDISMQGMNGLDVLRQISNERPSLPVLILSVHPEEQYALRALKAGAFGYLTKESAPEELIEAIRRVSAGRKYLRSSLAEKLTFEFSVDAQR